ATAHIVEEAPAERAGRAVGLYIAGTSVGGVSARLIPSAIDGWHGWRAALIGLAVADLVVGAIFIRLLPRTRNFSPAPLSLGHHLDAIRAHLREPGIRRLCIGAFLFMGGMTAAYTYLVFRLSQAPFSLPQAAVGGVFLAYFSGTITSGLTGRLVARYGR